MISLQIPPSYMPIGNKGVAAVQCISELGPKMRVYFDWYNNMSSKIKTILEISHHLQIL